MSHQHKSVTVYIATGQMEAAVVRGRLEAENIPAMLVFESVGQTMGLTVNGLGQVQVKVPEPFAKLARAIIDGTQPGDSWHE